jgi:hypothetical protein
MKHIMYVCATSNKVVAARVDDHALWMEMDQVTHLFGLKRAQTVKLLQQVRTTGEIDANSDLRESGSCSPLLSHRAIVAPGISHELWSRHSLTDVVRFRTSAPVAW